MTADPAIAADTSDLVTKFANNPEMIPIAIAVGIGAFALPVCVGALVWNLWLMWKERS